MKYYNNKNWNTKFLEGVIPFFADLKSSRLSLNMYNYNFITSIADLDLFRKGIRRHRNFRYNDTKKYFGLSGDRNQAYEQLVELHTQYKEFINHLNTQDNE